MSKTSREFPNISDWWNFSANPHASAWFDGQMARTTLDAGHSTVDAADWIPAEADGTDSALEPKFVPLSARV